MTRRKIAAAALALLAPGLVLTPASSEEARLAGRPAVGISANPAATEDTTGTGWLGRQLGLPDGIELGGVWVSAGNYLLSGGVDPGASFNSQLVGNLLVDLERTSGLKGTSFGVQVLQLNSQASNDDAGSVMGYIGLDGAPPLERSQLTQIWFRQELFDNKFNVRVGKSNPGADFANVIRPVHTTQHQRDIQTVTSLLYGPLIPPATLFGVLPGYYDTAYGVTSNWAPK